MNKAIDIGNQGSLGRFFLTGLACLLVASAFAADDIVLGAVYDATGAQADFDRPSINGARLAIDQANSRGGVLDRKVRLAFADGESLPAKVGPKTQELIATNPSLSALFGVSDTDLALAAARVAAEHDLVFLTSGATSPRLPDEVPEYLFMACFGDNVQAAAMAEWAYEKLGARTVSIATNTGDTYTKLLARYFQKRFESLGGTVVSNSMYTRETIDEMTNGLEPADIVFLSAQVATEASNGVEHLRKAGFDMPILGGDGYDAPDVWSAAKDIDKVYYATHVYLGADNKNPVVTKFSEAYSAAHPGEKPNAYAALSFDAANLLLNAIARAGSSDPDAVRKALATTANFEGVTGTISFTEGKRIPTKPVALLSVSGGNVSLVEELTPETVSVP